jgi:hypothetical protein
MGYGFIGSVFLPDNNTIVVNANGTASVQVASPLNTTSGVGLTVTSLPVNFPVNTSGSKVGETQNNVFASASPSAITASTQEMLGCGSTFTLTPKSSGNVMVLMFTSFTFSTASSPNVQVNSKYGTGTAPSNGASATGTSFGTSWSGYPNSTQYNEVGIFPYVTLAKITGLTVNTSYWFDIACTTGTSATITPAEVYCEAWEIL